MILGLAHQAAHLPDFEASAPLLLSAAVVLRICGCCVPYLGVRGTAKSNKSHGNELNESAD